MCLSKITQTENLPEEVVGWKVFVEGDKLNSLRTPVVGTTVYVDTWNLAGQETIYIDHFVGAKARSYSSGFHAYQTEKDTRMSYLTLIPYKAVVRKVRLRNLVCAGRGDGLDKESPQWVAREMWIEGNEPQS